MLRDGEEMRVLAAIACLLVAPSVARADTETTLVPLVGGSSDLGYGGGLLGAIARVEPGVKPYVWRLELASTTTVKLSPFTIPFEDDYVVLTVPELVPKVMRLEIRPSFTREGQLRYSGLGNASPEPDLSPENAHRYEYARTHPSLLVRTRLTLVGKLYLRMGVRATYNHLAIDPASVLANDRARGAPILGTDDHWTVAFEDGVVLDTRDDEVAPTSGQWHLVQARLAPGGTTDLPYRWGALTAILRAYVAPLGRRLVLAGRVVGDHQFGDVPFYELARFEDTYAIGGTEGVRGPVAQRYYGREKLFGNLEARSDLVSFHLLEKEMTFGVVGFFDAGRVWLPQPDVDGTGLGVKYGTGGGLRLRSGSSFVLRADVAWSPDAQPISAYFQGGQAF